MSAAYQTRLDPTFANILAEFVRPMPATRVECKSPHTTRGLGHPIPEPTDEDMEADYAAQRSTERDEIESDVFDFDDAFGAAPQRPSVLLDMGRSATIDGAGHDAAYGHSGMDPAERQALDEEGAAQAAVAAALSDLRSVYGPDHFRKAVGRLVQDALRS